MTMIQMNPYIYYTQKLSSVSEMKLPLFYSPI